MNFMSTWRAEGRAWNSEPILITYNEAWDIEMSHHWMDRYIDENLANLILSVVKSVVGSKATVQIHPPLDDFQSCINCDITETRHSRLYTNETWHTRVVLVASRIEPIEYIGVCSMFHKKSVRLLEIIKTSERNDELYLRSKMGEINGFHDVPTTTKTTGT